jgi:hypothetical protein
MKATPEHKPRRAYTKPAVIYEAKLEAQAGSPLGLPDLLDDLTNPQ